MISVKICFAGIMNEMGNTTGETQITGTMHKGVLTMRTLTASRIAALWLLLLCSSLIVSAASFDNYLKAGDIEKTTGLKGVKSIAKQSLPGAGGDLNFATADDKLIVMIQVVGKSNYAGYKKYFFKADIKGMGDEALEGTTIPGQASNLVAFTKGTECVALTTFGDSTSGGKKNMLTVTQLTVLAKIIASRMR
jgi:hypothetical protein